MEVGDRQVAAVSSREVQEEGYLKLAPDINGVAHNPLVSCGCWYVEFRCVHFVNSCPSWFGCGGGVVLSCFLQVKLHISKLDICLMPHLCPDVSDIGTKSSVRNKC